MITSLLAAAALSATLPSICAFVGEPANWTWEALESWSRLDRERIRMTDPQTPVLVLFDQSCLYRFTPDADGAFSAGGRSYSVDSEAHQGVIALPGGGEVPARKLSFAAPTEDGGMFFAMGLPALWRADTAEGRDPDRLAMVVFMHEFAHTQQGAGLGSRIDSLSAGHVTRDR